MSHLFRLWRPGGDGSSVAISSCDELPDQQEDTEKKMTFQRLRFSVAIFALALLGAQPFASALTDMSDSQMASIGAQGIAMGLENFAFEMAPTSYIQLIGSQPTSTSASEGWQRADIYLYGLSMTGAGPSGTSWFGSPCTTTAAGAGQGDLGCPLGSAANATIKDFASVYNPFVLRAFQYPGIDYQGNSVSPTVLELLGPTQMDPFRLSFWGEMQANQGGVQQPLSSYTGPTPDACTTTTCFLQAQTIFEGTLTATDTAGNALPSVLRLMQTTDTNSADASSGYYQSLGINMSLALSGNLRFSVAQNADSPNALHAVPDFNSQEGLFLENVNMYLPIGALDYQNVVVSSAPAHDGNFVVELMQIPNIANVYNNFYCGSSLTSGAACATNASGAVSNPNPLTHGFIDIGNNPTGTPLGTLDTQQPGNSTINGMFFQSPSGSVVNLGTSQINGILIQHMKITTAGAS